MNVLNEGQLAEAACGGDIADAAAVGGAFGGAIGFSGGVSSGLAGSALLGVTTLGAAAGAGLLASGALGYSIGTWINDSYGSSISNWVAQVIRIF